MTMNVLFALGPGAGRRYFDLEEIDMPHLTLVAVKCKIARSAFSDERIFTISLGPQKEYIGAASRLYCWKQTGERFGPDEPNGDAPIQGLIAARLVDGEGDVSLVNVPDGETIEVKSALVVQRPAEPRKNVSV
jgi:hypothetical protein